MESEEPNSSASDYAFGPPWLFKGSAIYQLHLVKAEIARSFIPKELKLVEAFGYTLGGFFLAKYDSSPAGRFDELVVIPGIVWNPPTSCAWAARVLVSSQEACLHGRKEVGLPSHVATFSESSCQNLNKTLKQGNGFSNILGISPNPEEHTKIQISESNGSLMAAFCNITLPVGDSGANPSRKWAGPRIRMSLPSFSGKTEYNRDLLKYSCKIECRIKPVKPANVSKPTEEGSADMSDDHATLDYGGRVSLSTDHNARNRCLSVLLSRPILALKLDSLKMQVEAPKIVIPYGEKAR